MIPLWLFALVVFALVSVIVTLWFSIVRSADKRAVAESDAQSARELAAYEGECVVLWAAEANRYRRALTHIADGKTSMPMTYAKNALDPIEGCDR